jgi:hypothetical protein
MTPQSSHTDAFYNMERQTEHDNDKGRHPAKQTKHTPSSFFSLPRELRNEIYSYVLNDEDHYILRFPGFDVVTGDKKERKLPDCRAISEYWSSSAWSFANKQTLAETIDVLTREKVFHVRYTRGKLSHIRYKNSMAWSDWNAEWTYVVEDMKQYQNQTIAESVRIIQLPIASNIWDNSIRLEDRSYLRRALSALLSTKKAEGATRPHLRLLWDYEILTHELFREPIFDFEKLSQFRGAFTSVRIVVMFSKHPFWDLGRLRDGYLYNEAWVEGVKDRLYELAEQWAKSLMGEGSANVDLRCAWSEQKPEGEGVRFKTWVKTVEVRQIFEGETCAVEEKPRDR